MEAAPAREVARLLRLLHRGLSSSDFFIGIEPPEEKDVEPNEVNVLFAVESPPPRNHLTQLFEVFNGLDIGVRRSLTMNLSTGGHPFFVGSFHVAHRRGGSLDEGGELFRKLRRLLYNTQILATESPAYQDFVLTGVMTGEEASLVNAFIGFCPHELRPQPAPPLHARGRGPGLPLHPGMALALVRLFAARFDPDVADRDARYAAELAEVEREVASYNTGHRQLDDFRPVDLRDRARLREADAQDQLLRGREARLAFRLDPAYLEDLGPTFTADLPAQLPFRVTFFFGRSGRLPHRRSPTSPAAAGGPSSRRRATTTSRWRTPCSARTTCSRTPSTSRTRTSTRAGRRWCASSTRPRSRRGSSSRRGCKLRWELANAFLDIFVTEGGRPKDPRVVDYYREEEPIELGPDENMHDEMIEAIAALSVAAATCSAAGSCPARRWASTTSSTE